MIKEILLRLVELDKSLDEKVIYYLKQKIQLEKDIEILREIEKNAQESLEELINRRNR